MLFNPSGSHISRGSIRALACHDRRLAGRNGRVGQLLSDGFFVCICVVGEGADHGTRGACGPLDLAP